MGEVTKVDTYVPPVANSKDPAPESVANMVQQAKSGVTRAQAEPVVKTERPAWLPEKFKTPEDLAKSYSELEKKLGAPKPQTPAAAVTPPVPDKAPAGGDRKLPETAPTGDEKAAEGAVAAAGLDMSALSAEFAQDGDLKPESYAKLEKAGITKDIVAGYIAGQVVLREKFHGELHAVAGGKEQFEQMHTWSGQYLPLNERIALNKVLDSGDHDAIKVAFAGVHAKWQAAGQDEPLEQIHGRRGSQPADVYTSRDEMMKDMRNPEYATNEAFRQKVMNKIKNSNIY